MGSLDFVISYGKNEGLVLSSSELLELYFYGIPLCTNDGRVLSRDSIKQHIKGAQKRIENAIQVKLNKQIYSETMDYNREEFGAWGYMKASFPVNEIEELKGMYGQQSQITYPKTWLSQRKTGDPNDVTRTINIVPNGSDASLSTNIYISFIQNPVFFGLGNVPNYWHVKYCTGFDVVPADILEVVAKVAAIPLLAELGDIQLGVGISSQSLSIDGISQSVSLNKSQEGGIYGGRIKLYMNELPTLVQELKDVYRGFQFTVV